MSWNLGHHGSNEVRSLEHWPGSEPIVSFRRILPAAKLRCMRSIGRQKHCASPNDNDAQLAHELTHSAVVKGWRYERRQHGRVSSLGDEGLGLIC